MFTSLRNSTTRTRLAAIIAPIALLGLTAAASAADGWRRDDFRDRAGFRDRDDNRWRDRFRGGFYVGIGLPPVVIAPQPRVIVVAPPPPVIVVARPDAVPSDLRLAAYQSRDTIIVLVSGANSGSGYSTALTSCNAREWTPTLILRNTPPNECAATCITPFTLTASLHIPRSVSSINITVAGQTYQIPVTEAPSLS